MRCITPHTMYRDGKNITVPCRQCMPCRINHAKQWSFRIEEEAKISSSMRFLTLTYADENLVRNDQGFPVLHKRHMQLFFKTLRRKSDYLAATSEWNEGREPDRQYKPLPIRYYCVGEYSQDYRPHYHAIVFNIPPELDAQIHMEKIWKHGIVNYQTPRSAKAISYVTKYLTKVDTRDIKAMGLTPPYNQMSLGLGKSYINNQTVKYHSSIENFAYTRKHGNVRRLPEYLLKKLHNLDDPNERLKLKLSTTRQTRDIRRKQREEDKAMREEGLNPGRERHKKSLNLIADINRK